MTRIQLLAAALALPLGLASAAGAQSPGQSPGRDPAGQGSDCFAQIFADARFTSKPLGDGRFLYEVAIANRSPTASVRYNYSFNLAGSTRPAEALHGYLTPGDSIEHALGTGDRNLSAQALRAATTMRCFPL
ncbi:hypothetical protein [Sediminicoccus sp. KRV36]|uniref:hypothetical protein n=1 Tax=Sediminicoccus sp. KRV36 TaxID=3133721 RepID=UPI00200FE7DB|nr:hypothetical protein [Sediminicoccus rosea]UPY37933.1 hypothetical protein LHU95_04335 [Sediminicoccus rosea]